MLLLNFVEGYLNVLKEALLEATDRSCGWSKVHQEIKKHGGGMMLVKVLVRTRNYGANVNRETQVRNSI